MTHSEDQAAHHGVVQSTFDVFLNSTRAVAEMVTHAGTAGARAVVPDPVLGQVTHMLTALRSMAEQAPKLTDELDVLVSEVHAKRLSIQALQAELSALDHQLEILETTLAPVQAWSRQWNRVQDALLHSLDLPTGTPD